MRTLIILWFVFLCATIFPQESVVVIESSPIDNLANCEENQPDFWRVRRCCTDRAAYAALDTIMVTVTDRIQNWNTWPWTFAGTTKAIVNSNDTIPHTVSLRLRNSSGEIVYDWESNVNLIPGDWSYSVPFLWWVQTTRELLLIDFEPGTYTLVATLRATGYMDDSIEVEFSIDSPVPVELSTFTAVGRDDGVYLSWTTTTETNNYAFELERQGMSDPYQTIAYLPGYGTTTVPRRYEYIDNEVTTGTYIYRLKQIDYDGSYEYSEAVGVAYSTTLQFWLSQNYPNPFNPSTTIKYSILASGWVRLAIHNSLGEEIAILVNEYQTVGQHSATFDGTPLPSGIYYYSLQNQNNQTAKTMILLK